jgi:PAS domain S-box-containing protein
MSIKSETILNKDFVWEANNQLQVLEQLITITQKSDDLKVALFDVLQLLSQNLQPNLIEIWTPNVTNNAMQLLHHIYKVTEKNIAKFSTLENTKKDLYTNKFLKWVQLENETNLTDRQQKALICNIKTEIILPIINNEKTIAVICIFYTQKVKEDNILNSFLKICSLQLSNFIQQYRLQHLVDNFFNYSIDLLCITNFSGVIQTATESFYKNLHLSKDSNISFLDVGNNKPFEINSKFIEESKTNQHNHHQITYTIASSLITINWSATIVENEQIIIFSGKNVTIEENATKEILSKNILLTQAQEDLKTILTNVEEVIFKVDEYGVFKELSENVVNLLGYERSELLNKSSLFLAHNDFSDSIFEILSKNELQLKDFKIRVKTKSDKWIWISLSGKKIFNNENKLLHILGICKDITINHDQYIINKLSEKKYKNFFGIHPYPMIIYDLENLNIIEVNEAACLKYGYTNEEFIDLNILSIRGVDEKHNLKSIVAPVQKSTVKNNFLTGIWQQKKKDGSYFIANIKYHQLKIGDILAVICTIDDITEEIKNKIALEESENRYKLFIENNSNSIYRYETKKPILVHQKIEILKEEILNNFYLAECNTVLSERLGYAKKEDLFGINIKELFTIQKLDYNNAIDAFIKNNFELNNFISVINDVHNNKVYLENTIKSFIENDHIIRVWGTTVNITQKIEDEKKYKYFSKTLKNIGDAVYTCTEDLTIVSWNDAAEQIYGIKREDIINKNLSFFISPVYEIGTLDTLLQHLKKYGKWVGSVNFEQNNSRKKVTLLTTATFTQLIDNTKQYIVISKDITEQTANNAKLQESENRFKYISNNAPVMLWQTNSQGNPIFYNTTILLFTGLTKEQQLATKWKDLIECENKIDIINNVENALKKREPYEVEYKLKNKDGNFKWVLDRGNPIILANGDFDGFIGICLEINDSKEAHEKMLESESRFKNIADQSSIMIWQNDKENNSKYYSTAVLNFTGFTLEEQINTKWDSLIHPADKKNAQEITQKAFANQQPFEIEYRFKNKNNDYKWILDKANPVFFSNGTFKGYVGMCINIDERKKIELKISESNKRFEILANQSPIMLWLLEEKDEKINFYNNKVQELLGANNEEINAKKWSSFVHSDDLKEVKQNFDDCIEQKKSFELEYRVRTKENNYRWIKDFGSPRFLEDGTYVGYVGYCIDITEKRNAEHSLQESETRFRNFADQAQVMFWLTNEKNKSIFYSKGWLDFSGNTLMEEINTLWVDKIHQDDLQKTIEDYNEAVNNKKSFILEYRFRNFAGEYIWLLDKGTPRYLSDGTYLGYVGVATEIQALKLSEEKLKIANDKFNILNEATNEALWDSDLVKDIGNWGVGYKKLFGHDTTLVNYAYWIDKVHPEDREKATEVFGNLETKDFSKNNILECEYRFRKADGTYAIVFDVAYIITNNEGKAIRMLGSKRDITEQKELEAKLLKTEIDKQISINKAVIEGQEKEKLELSQELHDNINQLISTSKLYMEVAKKQSVQPEMIEKAIETLGAAVHEIRRLSKTLNPITINELKLVDAIEQLILDIEQTGKLTIEFDYNEFDYDITLPQLNLYLYRIVQEQINNIIKYAKTDTAFITLKNNASFLYIKIEDKGVGFEKSKKGNGIGLSNIKNRVALFNGIIEIHSAPNEGCIIEINIPLNISYF